MGILFATAEEESSFFQDECSDCQEQLFPAVSSLTPSFQNIFSIEDCFPEGKTDWVK